MGSSERGMRVGFEKDAIHASFFFMTPGVECSINMVISPQTIASVEEWRSSIVYAALSLGEQVGDPQWNDLEAG